MRYANTCLDAPRGFTVSALCTRSINRDLSSATGLSHCSGPHGVEPGVGLPGCLATVACTPCGHLEHISAVSFCTTRGVMPLCEFAKPFVVRICSMSLLVLASFEPAASTIHVIRLVSLSMFVPLIG